MAPVAVTSASVPRSAEEMAERDSAVAEVNARALQAAMHRPTSGAELAELQQSQRAAEQLARRATTAGNSRDVHVMMGRGLGGAGAVGGGAGGSLPLHLLSSGPSREQRARDDEINADYQRRLLRLRDRIKARQDSIVKPARRPLIPPI